MSQPEYCPPHLYNLMRHCWHSEVWFMFFALITDQSSLQPSSRPSWSSLVDTLLVLYDQTLPGVYLDLINSVIPTPPSSPESRSSIFSHSNLSTSTLHIEPPPPYNPGYMPGISPLVPVPCFPTSHSPSSPLPPRNSQVALSRRSSEESGYSSAVGDGGLGGTYYYNV